MRGGGHRISVISAAADASTAHGEKEPSCSRCGSHLPAADGAHVLMREGERLHIVRDSPETFLVTEIRG